MRERWELSPPRWELASLRAGTRTSPAGRPLIPARSMIFRAATPSPELLERSASEEAPVLSVRFAVFGRWQEIDNPREGHFLERVRRGAFAKSIRENLRNIRAVLSHGTDPSIGDQVLGEIESIEEAPDAAIARVSLFRSVPGLLLDGLRAGVYGASFRGAPIKSHVEYRPKRSAHNPQGLPEVTRLEIKLRDIGPTPFAAYEGTVAKIGAAVLGQDGGGRELAGASRSAEPYWLLARDLEPYWQIRRKDARRGRTAQKN